MYFGLGAFFVIAILCVVVGAVALKRRRDYEYSEDPYPDEVNEPEE
jgi:Na+-transporting NADH:ubiquinone oxidoreductase subunit NqrE